MTTTATAEREVPFPQSQVWRALAVLRPYCAVCDVSYVVSGTVGRGTTFVCVPGRLEDGRAPAVTAPRGRIVEWRPMSLVETRLELTPEVWTTRIGLTPTGEGSTRVAITLTHEPTRRGSRVARFVQRTSMQRLLRRMLDSELVKVDAHVAQSLAA